MSTTTGSATPIHLHSSKWILACAVLVANAWSANFSVIAQEQGWSAGYDRLLAEEDRSRGKTTRDRANALGARFDSLAALSQAERPSELAPIEMELAFRAANLTHFYTQDEKHLVQMRLYFELFASKEMPQRNQINDMIGAYIAGRQWSDAKQIAERFSSMQWKPVPVVEDYADLIGGSHPTVLQVGTELERLRREPLLLESGPAIVVISHPLCQFSRMAVAAIESDPDLAHLMRQAHWIAPVDRQLHLEVLQRWNLQHPASIISLAYARSEWPLFDSWGTPTFYFMRDGKLLAKVEGWPQEGRKDQLIAAANAIGSHPEQQ